MDATTVLQWVLLGSAISLCGVAIWALIDFVQTSRSLRATSDETRERLVPLLDKADVTVDAVNAELLRVDSIITRFEDTSEKVTSASNTITDIVNAPAEIVNEAASRFRQAWKGRHRPGEPAPAEPPTTAGAESASEETDQP